MIAVRGYYRDGKITLLERLPESVREAELNMIVLPAEEEGYVSPPAGEYLVRESTSEEEFKALGLRSFFGTQDDADVDWEDALQVVRQIVDRKDISSIHVPQDFGERLEVIIFPAQKGNKKSADIEALIKLQEQSGFARRVLGDEKEDVWNNV
jgi:hypothetical protein